MPGYVYRGNDFSVDDPTVMRHRHNRKPRQARQKKTEVTADYIINTTRNRSVQRLVKAHQKEADKIKRVVISEYFGVTYDGETDYRVANNMMKMVLLRKYPQEFEQIKKEVRAEVEKEFNFKPRKVGEHSKKSQYADFVDMLVERDFT